MRRNRLPTSIFFLLFTAVFFTVGHSYAQAEGLAAGVARSPELNAAEEYAKVINEEYYYRQKIEGEAANWARDLMFIYRWSILYPNSRPGEAPPVASQADMLRRFQSEFAWLTLGGHGMLATFDFGNAEQSLLGSKSRFLLVLSKSSAFSIEVRNQCLEIQELRKSKGLSPDPAPVKNCAERLHRDLEMSQLVGSNASLFLGGGLVFAVGKKTVQKLFGRWFAQRVLPILPSFARNKWVLGTGVLGLTVVMPVAVTVASVSYEKKANQDFVDNLQTNLNQDDETDEASQSRTEALEIEREVIELAAWINRNLPSTERSGAASNPFVDSAAAQEFMTSLKLTGPHYFQLSEKRELLESNRQRIEDELRLIPDVSAKLQILVQDKKRGALKPEDARLYRKAQYLACLRLVLKTMPERH